MTSNPTGRDDPWLNGIAGAFSGTTVAVITHPLDVVQTRLQSNKICTTHYTGNNSMMGLKVASYMRTMLHREGMTSLYL